jgi:hypothetical protein
VYDEDEYFAQGGQIAEVARDGSGWPMESSVFSTDVVAVEGARGLRIAVGSLLIAGAGALGVVLALGAFVSSTHVRRKAALRAARANARTAGAASALTTARTTHLRRKTINGRARRVRPVVARHARPASRNAYRSWSNARSSKAVASRPAAGRALPSTDVTVDAPAFPGGRRSTEGSYGHRTEIAASPRNTPSRRGSGEFGFER